MVRIQTQETCKSADFQDKCVMRETIYTEFLDGMAVRPSGKNLGRGCLSCLLSR